MVRLGKPVFDGQTLYVAGVDVIKKTLANRLDFASLKQANGACLIGFAVWPMARVIVL